MSKTRESYNRAAKEYDNRFSEYTPYQSQIRSFVSMLSSGSLVLDVGCGSGLNSKEFVSAGHEVIGFDFSESMIEIARRNCPDGTFFVSTVDQFKPSRKFNAICLSFIIVHLDDHDTKVLIDRLSSSIYKEGLVYISFMTGKKPGYETTSFSDSPIYFNYFSPVEIISRFGEYGFKLVRQTSEPYAEEDGSITEDVFLIFRYCDNPA